MAALLLSAGLLAASPAQAQTTPPPDETSSEAVHDAVVGDTLVFTNPAPAPAEATPTPDGGVTLRAASFTITCTVDAQNPHISEGARKQGKIYVIYKSVVSCTGTGSYPRTAQIRVRGGLMWDSAQYSGDTSNGINWQQLRSSTEPRTVKVNGSGNTFYTPLDGQTGGTFTGHYQGSSTVEITSPAGFKVGSDISNVVFCKPTTATARCS